MATTNENINVTVTVDTTKSEQATINYKKQLKELREEMVNLEVATNGLSEATEEQRARYAELEAQSGKIADAIGDVNARINANADDYASFNAAMEGGKGIIAFGQGVAGVTNLLGMNSDAVNRGIQVMMGLQSVMSAVNTVQQIFNKDSKVMIAIEKLKVAALGQDKAATVGTTTATAAFAAGEGVATTASFTLAGACKAVGVAIKSIPVIGWILAAVAALITLTSLIVSCNKEADMGDKIAADILEKDRERKQELDDIARKHQKIAENLQEELDAIVGMDKQERQYKDTISAAAKELGISYEYAEKLYNEDREGLKAKIQLTEDYNASLDKITANEEKQNQARKDREALENRIQEIMAEGYETSQASLNKLVEEGKITEDQQAILQKYRNQRARSEMSLYNAQQSALVVVNSQLSAYQNIEDSCSNQLNTLKNTTKEQKAQINNLQTQSDLYAQEQKDAEEAKRKREQAAAAWKKFKSERDAAQKSYQQSVEDMAIADAEYDKDYDRLLEARKAKRNREYDEDKKKYDEQLKQKLITQEQYNTLVLASTEKLNNDIAKLEADNQKRIDDDAAKAKKESDEKRQQEDEAAAKKLANQYEIEAKEQEVAKARGRVAGLEEGTPEYFDALIEQAEAQRELELEQLEQDKEAKLLSEEDYQIRKKEIIDKYNTDNYNSAKYYAELELEAKTETQARIGELYSAMRSFINDIQEAELADYEGNEKKQKEIKKKYAIIEAMMNIGEIGINTAKGIMGAWSAYAEIPFVGPGLAAALTAVIAVLGAVQTAAAITQLNTRIKKAAKGTFVTGASHSEGGVMMELEGGEAVLNKRAMAIPQYRALASAMNVSTGGVAFPNTNSNAALTAQVDRTAVQAIVAETIKGVSAIPVVVSESDISKTVRKVDTIEGRSRI